jgi:hypothetical protein
MKKTTATAKSSSGFQSSKQVSGVRAEPTDNVSSSAIPVVRVVHVATYRQTRDHLLRVVNVDYCACVNVQELRYWLVIAERVLSEVQHMDCQRANTTDRQWRRIAIETALRRIDEATAKINGTNPTHNV